MPPREAEQTRATLEAALSRVSAAFDRVSLERLATELLSIVARLDTEQFPAAAPGEEVVYPLIESPNGPSIYIVSDGVGTSSPPHEHQTWAVIVGVSGRELNTFYAVPPSRSRRVLALASQSIGAGEFTVLDPLVIHATSVVGGAPTYHLHVYGRSLASLPAFTLRTYQSGA